MNLRTGKTLFLYYALLRALQTPQTIVFSTVPDTIFLFSDQGADFLDPRDIGCLSAKTFGLFDSAAGLQDKLVGTSFRAVLSTPLQLCLFTKFQEQRCAHCRVMSLWSEEEIASLRSIYVVHVGSIHSPLDVVILSTHLKVSTRPWSSSLTWDLPRGFARR